VAPVVAYAPEGGVDPPTGHMRFAGTISIPTSTFEQLLEGAARSFKSGGFRDIVFLGDHGDYQKSEAKVAAKLNREWKSSLVRVHPLPEYYAAASASYPRTLQARGFTAAEIGTHAGVADTSLALAIDPKLVRSDALPKANEATSGVYGDARRASADLGAPGIDIVVNESVAAIKRATRR
jgi:creatinine amidohydrolase/Fe(II)-dependent formamide hydrolase-like protein